MKQKKIKKLLSVLLVVTGVLSVVFGITVLAKPNHAGNRAGWTIGNNWNYDSSNNDRGYAKFGSDFYTYVSNNAATAAVYAYRAAEQAEDTKEVVKTIGGYLLIIAGLITGINGLMKAVSAGDDPTVKVYSAVNGSNNGYGMAYGSSDRKRENDDLPEL